MCSHIERDWKRYNHWDGKIHTTDDVIEYGINDKNKYIFNGGSEFIDATTHSDNQLTSAQSYDTTSDLKQIYDIDDELKKLLKDQIKEYINILKKLQLNSFKQSDPTKIEKKDLVDDTEYNSIKEEFLNNKKLYNESNELEFFEFIENQFKNNIPLIKMKQKISMKTFNDHYKKYSDKNKFFNGNKADHWYLLPREFNERFKKSPNILRLNKYLGLTPFHDLRFDISDSKENSIKIKDGLIGIHECYVFLTYLSSPKKNMLPVVKELARNNWEWHTSEFYEFLEEKYENKMFKCFCNFLEKRFMFNKKLDDIFEEYNNKNDNNNLDEAGEYKYEKESSNSKSTDNESRLVFLNKLNDLIENYALWDLINWSIPWSGEGRTLDYGLNDKNKYIFNGGSEFYIPSGQYLKSEFTPILTIGVNIL